MFIRSNKCNQWRKTRQNASGHSTGNAHSKPNSKCLNYLLSVKTKAQMNASALTKSIQISIKCNIKIENNVFFSQQWVVVVVSGMPPMLKQRYIAIRTCDMILLSRDRYVIEILSLQYSNSKCVRQRLADDLYGKWAFVCRCRVFFSSLYYTLVCRMEWTI